MRPRRRQLSRPILPISPPGLRSSRPITMATSPIQANRLLRPFCLWAAAPTFTCSGQTRWRTLRPRHLFYNERASRHPRRRRIHRDRRIGYGHRPARIASDAVVFPDLYKHLKLVSSTPIRNMATLAGNFVNASPIGDMTVWFLALNAEITLVTPASAASDEHADYTASPTSISTTKSSTKDPKNSSRRSAFANPQPTSVSILKRSASARIWTSQR